jgi:DNA-binding PadR family transcriptional regulator
LEDDVGVLVAFGLLDVKIISENYVDRVYRVTERGEKILEYILQDRDAGEMFNRLRLYITGLEGMSMSELVYKAKKLIRHAVNCFGLECLS